RMAMELGGGTEIVHDPDWLLVDPDAGRRPLVRAADLVVRCFCVGEALSIPLLRGTWKAAQHPLPRAVLGRIVRDEAMHGTFGFAFLDWAVAALTDEERAYLGQQADHVVRAIAPQWDEIRAPRSRPVQQGSRRSVPGRRIGRVLDDANADLARTLQRLAHSAAALLRLHVRAQPPFVVRRSVNPRDAPDRPPLPLRASPEVVATVWD